VFTQKSRLFLLIIEKFPICIFALRLVPLSSPALSSAANRIFATRNSTPTRPSFARPKGRITRPQHLSNGFWRVFKDSTRHLSSGEARRDNIFIHSGSRCISYASPVGLCRSGFANTVATAVRDEDYGNSARAQPKRRQYGRRI
jgi:hypothetical protein